MDSLERNRKISSFVVHLTLVLISITMLVPFFWMVLTAFKSTYRGNLRESFYYLPEGLANRCLQGGYCQYEFSSAL